MAKQHYSTAVCARLLIPINPKHCEQQLAKHCECDKQYKWTKVGCNDPLLKAVRWWFIADSFILEQQTSNDDDDDGKKLKLNLMKMYCRSSKVGLLFCPNRVQPHNKFLFCQTNPWPVSWYTIARPAKCWNVAGHVVSISHDMCDNWLKELVRVVTRCLFMISGTK